MWSDRRKIALKKKYFEINNSFCSLYVKLATVQIWGQLNKFSLTCSSLKCLLLRKILFRENSAEKIFLFRKQTPGENVKPRFLRQHLVFFNNFFLKLEITFRPILWPKNPDLKKIVHLKVYGNLNWEGFLRNVTHFLILAFLWSLILDKFCYRLITKARNLTGNSVNI